MRNIIIDTNFLMIPFQFRVDIFSEFGRVCHFNYKLFIFEQSIDELKNIAKHQPGKHKKAAQLALKLVRAKGITLLSSSQKDADSAILEAADKEMVVATQDAALKRELLKKNASLIILRQKKYLQLIERKLYK